MGAGPNLIDWWEMLVQNVKFALSQVCIGGRIGGGICGWGGKVLNITEYLGLERPFRSL